MFADAQCIGQSLGSLVANVVFIKVDAREGLVDLQNRKRNAVWSMVTGVKNQETRKINAQRVPQ